MFDHRQYYPREQLHESGRLSHLVFVDGRLVDAWSEDVEGSAWTGLAQRFDDERRPPPVQAPAPPPVHAQVLAWLERILGGRDALLTLDAREAAVPRFGDDLDPVADEPWLVTDELVADVGEALLARDMAAPLRACLLLAREALPQLADRMGPVRLAGGIVWVVGKANAAIGPEGPIGQKQICDHLGTKSLTTLGQQVHGHVRRLGWPSPRPWGSDHPPLYPTGRPELLCQRVRADLVDLRDQALAEQAAALSPG